MVIQTTYILGNKKSSMLSSVICLDFPVQDPGSEKVIFVAGFLYLNAVIEGIKLISCWLRILWVWSVFWFGTGQVLADFHTDFHLFDIILNKVPLYVFFIILYTKLQKRDYLIFKYRHWKVVALVLLWSAAEIIKKNLKPNQNSSRDMSESSFIVYIFQKCFP